jgi:exodeoxyribonuclease V alpha subunit
MVVEVKGVRRRKEGMTELGCRGGEGHEPVIVIGYEGVLDQARAGQWLEIEGKSKVQPSGDLSFRVSGCSPAAAAESVGVAGLLRLLETIPGVGPKAAARIQAAGVDSLRAEPALIGPFVSSRHREAALAAWLELNEGFELRVLLTEVGVPLGRQTEMLAQFDGLAQAWEALRTDPWSVAGLVKGIGFMAMDALALRLGTPAGSFNRLRHGAGYVARTAAEGEGHTVLRLEDLVVRASELLGVKSPLMKSAILECPELKMIGVDLIGLQQHVRAEQDIASVIAACAHAPGVGMTAEVLSRAQAVADQEGEQGEAVRLLNSHALALLEGPAGTGKTAVAGVLCEASRAARKRVALVAPTGLAAHNLSEVGRQPAETIHRFVGRVERDEAQAVDLVIADEASMISSELMRRLMRSSRDLPSPIRTRVHAPYQAPTGLRFIRRVLPLTQLRPNHWNRRPCSLAPDTAQARQRRHP